jgi:hypothetical protein
MRRELERVVVIGATGCADYFSTGAVLQEYRVLRQGLFQPQVDSSLDDHDIPPPTPAV